MLDSLQVPYHHTSTFPHAITNATTSSKLMLGILVGFVEEYMSSITEATHQGALIGKEEDNGNQTFHGNKLICRLGCDRVCQQKYEHNLCKYCCKQNKGWISEMLIKSWTYLFVANVRCELGTPESRFCSRLGEMSHVHRCSKHSFSCPDVCRRTIDTTSWTVISHSLTKCVVSS